MQKSAARKRFRELRDHLFEQSSREEWGKTQLRRALDWIEESLPNRATVRGNLTLAGYFPVGSELNLLPDEGDEVWLFPKVAGESLVWFPWRTSESPPPQGPWGIPEASGGKPILAAEGPFLVFVPALAVNDHGYRLGYGGGYYDRMLADPELRARSLLVCCVPDLLMEADFPVEEHDIKMDLLVSEKRVKNIGICSQQLKRLGISG